MPIDDRKSDLTAPAAEETKAIGVGPGLRRAMPADETPIYKTIFDGIMNQRLMPGTKLPENELCDVFGASRSLVRRVLQRLAHDHIVEIRPNRGAIVATPSPEETRQIFEARRGLEGALVKLAARNATAADYAKLRQQLHEEHEAMHRFDQPSWARLASAFHLQVATLANNPILEAYLQEIVSRCSLIVAVYQPWGNASCEHDEHASIVDCMESGQVDRAIELMEQHLLQLEGNISFSRDNSKLSLKDRLGLK
ncbi:MULTISPECIES: GntR family transcriptional regulator [unclassified Beijerinckia]|uniref:GntR family transcriptional regulator n=1 Tax=unclassified Beijerinckia TaxID=2638183 RepID=UPI000895B168|nr:MULTISPECIES: GntR family transcriptional regulator [unclassified Beijerinckia]MDH7797088.1 DNA-binding GntR family transcriptional regulator [Beijerinckia sp. GAS462]SEC71757.1 transcriptional regulator, GntR family [Beijerinckia sp. 28-YEA-48]